MLLKKKPVAGDAKEKRGMGHRIGVGTAVKDARGGTLDIMSACLAMHAEFMSFISIDVFHHFNTPC